MFQLLFTLKDVFINTSFGSNPIKIILIFVGVFKRALEFSGRFLILFVSSLIIFVLISIQFYVITIFYLIISTFPLLIIFTLSVTIIV